MNGQFKISYEQNQRPRRPNEDTLSYIKSLPLELDQATREINEYFESKSNNSSSDTSTNKDDDYPQLFSVALTAIDEIRTEIASLAGDEAGSQFLEILTRIVAPYSELAVRKLLAGCSGYYLHLCTHRYGSHVVQTLLQLATVVADNNNNGSNVDLAQTVMADEEEEFQKEQENLPTLSELILGVAEELTPQASQLAMHICGSHVLRTLMCVLTGVDLVPTMGNGDASGDAAFRRGKKKSKKKKKKPSPAEGASTSRGLMHMVYRNPSHLRIDIFGDQGFSAALDALTQEISQSNDPGVLQKLASHPSAGPFLIVLLRVLTYASCTDQSTWQNQSPVTRTQRHLGIELAQPKFQLDSTAHQLAKNILCWPDNDDTGDKDESSTVSDIIYGLAGEPRGSHVLETLFWCSPGPFYESLLTYGNFYERATIEEYIDDPIGNFVVQTLLRTIQTKVQAERILKAMVPIISTGSVIDAEKKRRGILWRTVELAATHRVGQDGTLKAIRLGFAALQGSGTSKTPDSDSNKESESGKKGRRKASAVEMQDAIMKLLDAKKDEAAGRVTLDVMGARTVHFMLRFAPRLCEGTIDGIASYSEEMLVLFAKDGLASACIWDGILDGPTESPTFSKGLQKMREKLSGHWVALSCDRCGQHVVKKLFRASTEQERLKMAEELSHGIQQLSGSSMGRSVMEESAARHFSQGLEEWRHAIKKASHTSDDWEKEVFGDKGNAGPRKKQKTF